ncbi:hypothetical protein HanXRQr2_Chr17g0826091 [Helianthus annuus]|uniref:Uncharacterized protein n=1 Tax=Helianthus annuus TaxID=4232 RepID=A0A9K3DLU0_HELAN|nr:hypothetical protein HanXRQr2_Chr17g0826091 [Helianthus annuus]KAJ0815054.1 hypothetical protein HanPSC8_Chr17g0793031 [Helianthus annuus]
MVELNHLNLEMIVHPQQNLHFSNKVGIQEHVILHIVYQILIRKFPIVQEETSTCSVRLAMVGTRLNRC